MEVPLRGFGTSHLRVTPPERDVGVGRAGRREGAVGHHFEDVLASLLFMRMWSTGGPTPRDPPWDPTSCRDEDGFRSRCRCAPRMFL